MVKRYPIDGGQLILRPAVLADGDMFASTYNEVVDEGEFLLGECYPMDGSWVANIIAGAAGIKTLLLVAQLNGDIVGGCLVMQAGGSGRTSHVCNLAIHLVSDARGMGIGTRIMEYVFEWAAYKGYTKICLSVIAFNHRAISLYRKMGFVEEGRRRGQFYIKGRYIDEILMAKFL